MAKKRTTVKLKCPLCNLKMWDAHIRQHRQQFHQELSDGEFEQILIEAVKTGKTVAKVYEGGGGGPISGTQKIRGALSKHSSGVSKIVQGGRTSPK